MIRVGDHITRRIKVYDASTRTMNVETMETTVVYIHPERRFYVVRCDMPGGRHFNETLYFFPRCGQI